MWRFPTGECGGGAVAVSSDGSYVAASGGNAICLLARSSKEIVHRWPVGGFSTDSIDISNDGRYVAAGGEDRNPPGAGWIALFERSSMTPLWSQQTERRIVSVVVSVLGGFVATQGLDGMVRLFSMDDGTLLWAQAVGSGGAVNHPVAVSDDGAYIAAGTEPEGGAPSVFLFSRSNAVPLWGYTPPDMSEWVSSIDISADGSYVAAGDYAGRIFLLSGLDGTPIWIHQESQDIYSVAISEGGAHLVAGGRDGHVYMFSGEDGNPTWAFQTGGPVYTVAISADGNRVAAGSQVGRLYLFSASSGLPLWSYDTGTRPQTLSLSSDGRFAAATGNSADLHILEDPVLASRIGATLTAEPQQFELQAGDTLDLEAGLTSAGSPMAGQPVTWSADYGGFDAIASETDRDGRAMVRYIAPLVPSRTAVTITAFFPGDSSIAGTSVTLLGVVEPPAGNPHSPIFISGDDQFTVQNGVTAGTGTADDPFIIEGWVISTSKNHGIKIEGTQSHLVIRNLSIVGDGTQDHMHDGISLGNVANCRIEGAHIEGVSGVGISVQNSLQVVIINNRVFGSVSRGIQVYRTDGILIDGNTVGGVDDNGIELEELATAIVTGNTASDSAKHGIGLYHTSEVLVKHNISRRNGWCGISIRGATGLFGITSEYGSRDNTVAENDIFGNGMGPWGGCGILVKENSHSNILERNTVQRNHGSGITVIMDSDDALVRGNEVSANSGIGIFVENGSDDVVVVENVTRHNGQEDLVVQNPDRATLADNIVGNDTAE